MSDVVRGTALELKREADEGRLALRLAKQVRVPYRASEETGQIGAWKRSLPALFDVLTAAGLDHVQVIPEHRLPYSPYRIDAVLCGTLPGDEQPSYVLVELKQWTTVMKSGDRLVVPRTRRSGVQPELHPAEQVRRYCRHLLDFTPQLARTPDAVRGLAYMHNARRDPTWDLDDFDFDDFGQLYTGDRVDDLIAYLKERLDAEPDHAGRAKAAADRFLSIPSAPARTLMSTVAPALHHRTGFVLLNSQQVAVEVVHDAVDQVGQQKKVVVVRGGPGSGKSAIALTLMATLAERGRRVVHATGSKAFTETLREVSADDNDRVRKIFTYFNQFDTAGRDSLDVLICDEAQRIRSDQNTPPQWLGRTGQTVRLIDSARVPVFLLDDDQVIRPRESGTPEMIVRTARAMGCDVVEINLEGQFRCGGSPLYDEWVRRVLGLAEGGPVGWSDLVEDTDDEYVVDCVETPQRLESWLRRQMGDSDYTARIAAGFCWRWSDPV